VEVADAKIKTRVSFITGSNNCPFLETLNLRATVAEREAALHRTLSPGLDQNRIDQDVEVRMARTQQLKQALLRKAGLDAQVTEMIYWIVLVKLNYLFDLF
jgi:diadenosine tetraphosphatase ApaH/serine/threonine PP2A family protein phosphatase